MCESITSSFIETPSDMNGNSIPKLDSLLLDFLEDKGVAHLRRYSKVLQKIEKVVNPLLKEVKKRDKRLNFEPMSPDGYFQIIRRNVVEVFIVFKKLDTSKISFVEVDSPAGTAFVCVKDTKLHKKWSNLIQGGTSQGFFLSSSLLRQSLNAILQDISGEKCILGPKVWFHSTNNEEDGLVLNISHEGEQLFVHLTPTISLKGVWPNCAAMWKKVLFRWPDDAIRQKIVSQGIHVVSQPVKSSLEHSTMFWQVSFMYGEKVLIQIANTGCRNKCLQILKTLLEDTLCYPEGITPFHLETVTLHLNSLISSPSLWLDNCLGARFLDLLTALQKSLAQENCSHFFAPAIHLYSDIPPSVSQTLAARVKHIIDFPVEFFQTFILETMTTQF